MSFPFFNLILIVALGLWPFSKGVSDKPVRPSSLAVPSPIGEFETLRVRVLRGVASVTVATETSYEILDAKGRLLFRGNTLKPTEVRVILEGLRFGNQILRDAPILIRSAEGIQLNKRWYRNAIQLFPTSAQKMMAINHVQIDDYLKGVLPWEANPKWHAEALKAQAIASRTYALFNAIERAEEPYDLSSDVMSQVYKGKSIEKPATDYAIESTRGMILTYLGRTFPAFFHSTSGGATTQAEYVWNIQPHPALTGVRDDFSGQSKHFRWEYEIQTTDMLQTLEKKGYAVTCAESLAAEERDASGRAREFVIRCREKSWRFHSNDFRIWMDPAKLKSTKISVIEKTDRGFLLKGFGWGHGVGMSQYSAKRLAEIGYDHRKILRFFYPGTDIKSVY